MTAEQLRAALLRRWRLVVVLALCAGVGAFVASQFMSHQYRAFALVQVVVNPADPNPSYVLGGDSLIATENQLATSPTLLATVAKRYPGLTASQLAGEVEATQYGNTTLMEIMVLDASPTRAAALANDIAAEVIVVQEQTREQQNAQFLKPYEDKLTTIQQVLEATTASLQTLPATPENANEIATLQARLKTMQAEDAQEEQTISKIEVALAMQGFTLQLAQPAEPNYTAVRPILVANVLGGAISGILLGILAVIALELRDLRGPVTTRFLTDIEIPILATLPEAPGHNGRNSQAHLQGDLASSRAELDAYRGVQTALGLWSLEHPVRVLTVSSIGASQLSSSISANLAVSLAALGEAVLLIEAQTDQQAQARRFGIQGEHGLNNAVLAFRNVQAAATAGNVTQFMYAPASVNAPNLRVMPAGSPWANARRALGSAAMTHVLEAALGAGAQRVVVDTPDPLRSPATRAIAGKGDGMLLIVDPTLHRKHHLLRARTELASAGVRVLGCIWTRRSTADTDAPARYPEAPGALRRAPAEGSVSPLASPVTAHQSPISDTQPDYG